MFKYILFDLDGTLTDPKIGITRSVQYALCALGIDEPCLDKLESFIGPPLSDSFREFYGLNEEQIVMAIAKYRERFAQQGIYENEIYPGISEMLAELKKKGKKLAIASSKPTLFVERILDYFDIRMYFDFVIGSTFDTVDAETPHSFAISLIFMYEFSPLVIPLFSGTSIIWKLHRFFKSVFWRR